MYTITKHTKDQAKKYNLEVKPSTRKNKKIDVYKNGRYITSVGATGYSDYGTYINTHGINYAKERRRLYRIRHDSDRRVHNSDGWYASVLLW